jgi:hypothetical protein
MVENHKALRKFVVNFFNLESYLQPSNEPLTDSEIEAFVRHPGKIQSDRSQVDRLLDDGEALEMIVDQPEGIAETLSGGVSNVMSFEEIKKSHPAARVMRQYTPGGMMKAAATGGGTAQDDENELKFEDDQVEGFIQIVTLKENRFMVSGHFRVKAQGTSLRLIFPDGQVVADFDIEEGLRVFRTIVPERVVLSDICYELY